MSHPPSQLQGGNQDPVTIRLDPKCLHSALKEFFDPLRTDDSRTDFFAVYRRESGEFDRDYTGKYDEDLNTSLIFAGLFSAVSSAFIIDVQSKLEPDPNHMTAAYMQILIHAVNGSIFPDANASSVTWTGAPSETVTVQCLLYASLATSLFAAFLAMLGKQWVNRYIRNRGGSAADKSRDRQRKLDALEKWRFHLTIESLPVMLQLGLLLLGCALSLYLWTISRTVAAVILTFVLFGITSYTLFTLAGILCYHCPYQTPLSIFIRTLARYLAHNSSTFARSLRYLAGSLVGIYYLLAKNLRQIFRRLRTGVPGALRGLGYIRDVPEGMEHIPLAVVELPGRFFNEISTSWEPSKADARCISWMLHSTTDADVIFSTVRFAADTIWYPEIAQVLSPHILADLFFDYLLDGRVAAGKSEHVSAVGMALASVLSIQLSIEPDREDLKELSDCLYYHSKWVSSSEPTFLLGMAILRIVSETPSRVWTGSFLRRGIFSNVPDHLPTSHKLCLSRVILQTIWRWRRIQDHTTVFNFEAIGLLCKIFMADGDHILPILKINCFLIIAISLGLRIDNVRDLYAPNKEEALGTTILVFHQQLQASIKGGNTDPQVLTSVLSALCHLDPFRVTNSGEFGFSWITEILNSGYTEKDRYRMAGMVVQLLGKEIDSHPPKNFFYGWIPPLLGFLSLGEKFYTVGSQPDPGVIALRILLLSPGYARFGETLSSILASALSPTHPLRSRTLALMVFHKSISGWLSSEMDNIPRKGLGKLLRAVGDPFQFTTDLPLQDVKPGGAVGYEPMMVAVVLIELASSDLWRNHLSRSNFTSCEGIVSTEEGKKVALGCMLETATHSWSKLLCTPAKITAAIRRLEELQCPNTAEVVVLWAWTIGVTDAVDHDAWESILRDTLLFYQTHGKGRLITLKRHIVDANRIMEAKHMKFLLRYYKGPPCRVGSVRYPVPIAEEFEELKSGYLADLRVSRVCQLRRFYHLFGLDPSTWKEEEAVIVEEVGEETDASSGRSVVVPVQFTDQWVCDYP